MLEWIKNLEPEFIILFGSTFVLIYFSLINMRRAKKTLNLIGKRALTLTEELMNRDNLDVIDIVIVNTSYVNVEAGAVGFIYKKVNIPMKEESILVLARDSFKISIPIEDLRTFVVGKSKKIKKIFVYAEDSLGRKTICRAKNATRKIRELVCEEHIVEKKKAKIQRFVDGKYLFGERIILVLKVMVSPITNISRAMKNGLNKRLKRREIKLEIRNIEKKHKDEMNLVFDEQRREEQILNAQKKVLEEKKMQEAELKSADQKRRDELKKVQEELRKIDALIKKETDDKVRFEKEISLKKNEIKEKESLMSDQKADEKHAISNENDVEIEEENEEKAVEKMEKTEKKVTKNTKKKPVETPENLENK